MCCMTLQSRLLKGLPVACMTSSRAPADSGAAAEASGSPASCSDRSASAAGTPPGLADTPGGRAVSVQPNPLFNFTPSPDASAAEPRAGAYAPASASLAARPGRALPQTPVPGSSGLVAVREAAGSAAGAGSGSTHAGFGGHPGDQGGTRADALSPEVLAHVERQALAGASGPSADGSGATERAPGASMQPGGATAPDAAGALGPSGPSSGRGSAAGAGRSGAGPRSSSSAEREPLGAREGSSASGVRVSPSTDEQAAIALGLGLNPSPSPTLEASQAPMPRTPHSAVRRRDEGPAEGEGPAIGRPLRVATPIRSVTAAIAERDLQVQPSSSFKLGALI